MGFSVTGRVLNSQDGEGVPDVTVTLNNQIRGNRGNVSFSAKVKPVLVLRPFRILSLSLSLSLMSFLSFFLFYLCFFHFPVPSLLPVSKL